LSLESSHCGVDVVTWAEDHSSRTEMAWCECSAGVEEPGMYARVAQEPGRAQRFLDRDAVRAPRKKLPRPVGGVRSTGANRTADEVAPSEGNEVRRDDS